MPCSQSSGQFAAATAREQGNPESIQEVPSRSRAVQAAARRSGAGAAARADVVASRAAVAASR